MCRHSLLHIVCAGYMCECVIYLCMQKKIKLKDKKNDYLYITFYAHHYIYTYIHNIISIFAIMMCIINTPKRICK